MKQILLFTTFLIITCSSLSAKTDTLTSRTLLRPNTIQLHAGDYYMPDTEHAGKPVSQIGVTLQRIIFKGLTIGVGYTKWRTVKYGGAGAASISYFFYNDPIVGAQHALKNYQMLDFWLSYKTKIAPQHYISPVVGVSHCWGLDYYYYSHVVLSPIESETLISNNKAQYNGIIGGVTYDYYFLNNRLNIGADILFRYYPQRIKQQYDSGIHIGFNF